MISEPAHEGVNNWAPASAAGRAVGRVEQLRTSRSTELGKGALVPPPQELAEQQVIGVWVKLPPGRKQDLVAQG